jgi:hypothetical protein
MKRIEDIDLFIYTIIGEKQWNNIPTMKKLYILKKYHEIQKIIKENYIS